MLVIVLNMGSFCIYLYGFERYIKVLKGKLVVYDNEIVKMFLLMR